MDVKEIINTGKSTIRTQATALLESYNSVINAFRILFATAWLSIVIVLIVLVLITQMDQGGTLITQLLQSPGNLLLFVALVAGLSLVVSHYPDYIEKNKKISARFDARKPIAWHMSNKIFCLGFITYTESKSVPKGRTIRQFDLLKRMLGTLLLWAVFYTVLHAYKSYIDHGFPLTVTGYGLLVFYLIHYVIIYRIKSPVETGNRKLIRWMMIQFWLSLILLAGTLILSFKYGWHPSTYLTFLLTLFFMTLTYNIFRNLRYSLQFHTFSRPLKLLSNDLNFVRVQAVFGWVAMAVLILGQIYIFLFNPMVIIVALLYTFYGLIIHPIKHKMYYSHEIQTTGGNRMCAFPKFIFFYIAPISAILVAGLTVLAMNLGNNLHLLVPVEEKNYVDEREYREALYNRLEQNPDSTIYFIASYGGGLMANAWNCYVLDTLSRFAGKNILQYTVAMSGVSGGAMGQGMYAAISKNYKTPEDKKLMIRHLAQGNFLSLDMAWMVGRDFFREWNFVTREFTPDRAKRSFYEYSKILDDSRMTSVSYRQWFRELFVQSYYPALIVNSTSTHSTRGIACSVKLNRFDRAFPNAENVLDNGITGKSLSYADALSISNRFPFLSPAAKIEGHGHYVDGGYFENSGMLSLYDFYNYLREDPEWGRRFGSHKIVFIQIMNGKGSQVNELIGESNIEVRKTAETGEIAAVIGTITSIAGLPQYFNRLVRNHPEISYVPIYLPYHLTEDDFKSYLGAAELSGATRIVIDKNNAWVETIRGFPGRSPWETAEPPLARMLSPQSDNYMKAVIRNGEIFKRLEKEIGKNAQPDRW